MRILSATRHGPSPLEVVAKKSLQKEMTLLRRGMTLQKGTTLLEGLVALAIFSIGLLGIAGLQLKIMHANEEARYRATASLYAQELIGLATADYANVQNYFTHGNDGAGHAANCIPANGACKQWVTHLRSTLPNPSAVVTYSAASGQFSIRITWNADKSGSARDSYACVGNLKATRALSKT